MCIHIKAAAAAQTSGERGKVYKLAAGENEVARILGIIILYPCDA